MYRQIRKKSPVASKSRNLLTQESSEEYPLVSYSSKRSPSYYRKKNNPIFWSQIEQSSSSSGLPPRKKIYSSGKKPNLNNLSNFESIGYGSVSVYENINGKENQSKFDYISASPKTFYSPSRTFEVEDVEESIPLPSKPTSQTFYAPSRTFEVEDVEESIPLTRKPTSQTFYAPSRTFEVEDILSFKGKKKSKKSKKSLRKKRKSVKKNRK